MDKILKRLFDLVVSITGLLLLSPLIIIIAILIKMHDSGTVFYKAQRTGLNGSLFFMHKFRTMVLNADKTGPSSSPKSDPRVTPIGRFLRKYKLDELAQLFDVLSGKMSIIGPRPEEKRFTDMFSEGEKKILSVKPGITDWASIWNSNESELLEGSDDPDDYYLKNIRPEKLRLQLLYAEKHNFFIDLQIFFLTLRKIVFKR
jgi:lipopolysaccharide/colanic/teichoic acid biosynthesis glycosyltransferase